MKIQLSQERIAPEHLTVWNAHGPSVDMVMDLKHLTFRKDSIEQVCAFHVLDGLFPDEVKTAITNWRECLKPGGKLYIVVDDFEYIARAFVGGDISLEVFNEHHAHPTQFDRKALGDLLISSGFPEPGVKIWFDGVAGLFPKKHYELIIEATK